MLLHDEEPAPRVAIARTKDDAWPLSASASGQRGLARSGRAQGGVSLASTHGISWIGRG